MRAIKYPIHVNIIETFEHAVHLINNVRKQCYETFDLLKANYPLQAAI